MWLWVTKGLTDRQTDITVYGPGTVVCHRHVALGDQGLDRQTDITVLSPVISQRLRWSGFIPSLWQSYDLHDIRRTQNRGLVGVKVFITEHALAYPQPQFQDMWRFWSFHLYCNFVKCGVEELSWEGRTATSWRPIWSSPALAPLKSILFFTLV